MCVSLLGRAKPPCTRAGITCHVNVTPILWSSSKDQFPKVKRNEIFPPPPAKTRIIVSRFRVSCRIYVYIYRVVRRWTLPSFKEKRRRLVGRSKREEDGICREKRKGCWARQNSPSPRRWKIARRHWPYQLYLLTKKRIKRIHLLDPISLRFYTRC